MRVADLSSRQLHDHLRDGLYLRTGRLVFCLRSTIPTVRDGIATLYADYLLAPQDFADFHISLHTPGGWRRWIKRQVLFTCDGYAPFKPLPYGQAFPMLEWGLNWCVSSHAHSFLMIHAAVVERAGRAMILPAPPGSGKSTLCAALVLRGWRLLSDEMALIRLQDGLIEPLPRPVSLKNRSIEVIKAFAPDTVFSPLVADTIKGTVAHMKPPSTSLEQAELPARPAWLVFPRYQSEAATQLTALPTARAFLQVAENAFNYSLLGSSGFQTLAGMMDSVTAYDFTYSNLDEAIALFGSLNSGAEAA